MLWRLSATCKTQSICTGLTQEPTAEKRCQTKQSSTSETKQESHIVFKFFIKKENEIAWIEEAKIAEKDKKNFLKNGTKIALTLKGLFC
jgi:hypothetical protein